MRTLFTAEDIKNIMENIYNGNMRQSNLSKGTIPYTNENSEPIIIIDEESGSQTQIDLAKYLNIKFYTWKERLVEKGNESIDTAPELSTFDAWVQSLNFSMNEAYALVELIDEEVTASQDIDSATKIGRITFIIQTDKIKNLDYYVSKIRNAYLGNPQDIQNSYGDIVKSYIMMGTLLYDQEPTTMQLGECVIVSCNFRLTYLNDAQSYNDIKVQISLNGDDLYDEDGNIVDAQGEPTATKYLTMPITKHTWQMVFSSDPVPTSSRPDLTGFVAKTLSMVKTLTFFDFNKDLTLAFNDLFWKCGAYRYDGKLSQVKDVNIPVYVRVVTIGADKKEHSYVFKDVIDNMQKVLTNNDFNISSITLKGWGKIEQTNII